MSKCFIFRAKSRLLVMAVLIVVTVISIEASSAWASPAAASIYIDPSSRTVEAGESFTVNVMQDVDVENILVQCTLSFNQKILQVVSITPGPQWAAASFAHGEGNPALDAFVAQSNKDGEMETMACMWIGGGPTPAGDHVFLAIEFQAIASGTSTLALSELVCGDIQGNPIEITSVDGKVVVQGEGGDGNGAPKGGCGAGTDVMGAVLFTGIVIVVLRKKHTITEQEIDGRRKG